MRRHALLIIAGVLVVLALVWAYGAAMMPYGGWWGGMGPHMMGPGWRGYSSGWGQYGSLWPRYGCDMVRGYGWGYMDPGWRAAWGNLNLSADDVKNYFARWISCAGNPRLKLGDVKEMDANTITVEILTKDNSLVQRFLVNRRTGFFQPSED